MARVRRVVVVGGGVVGVSTAYYLAGRGVEVILLEQEAVGSGASQGNAGQITAEHLPLNRPGMLWGNVRMLLQPLSPLYIPLRFDWDLWRWLWRFQRSCRKSHVRRATDVLNRLGRASAVLFEQLDAELDFRFRRQSRYEICLKASTLREAGDDARLLAELGSDLRLVDGDEMRELEPALTAPVAGAVEFPDACYCDPALLVQQLAEAAGRSGAVLRTGQPVVDVQSNGDGKVRVCLPAEEIEADAVVLACGAWAPRLAGRLGLKLPVQPGKGYHLDLDLPNGTALPKNPLTLLEERIFFTPYDDHVRLAGTMEFSGFNLRKHPTRLKMLARGASRYMAGVGEDRLATARSQWCHLRPMSPDGLPLIGPVPGAANTWLATGHGMLGLTQGPITGKLIADALVDGRMAEELEPLRPDRFGR